MAGIIGIVIFGCAERSGRPIDTPNTIGPLNLGHLDCTWPLTKFGGPRPWRREQVLACVSKLQTEL
ncbi:uncharacterized protein N7503_006126 [Penicillium pulvis]|uniref:uncharacterized protein n=1 Tax=Penicillium pulvis TaxID=1562058 RepID=UPI0025466A7C|nr:uncharacterized protein N7503_006126 [Penicillium pulvis]KAJ5803676.1 hypothetical protein N7503_006126 [Penicillium pulvis]